MSKDKCSAKTSSRTRGFFRLKAVPPFRRGPPREKKKGENKIDDSAPRKTLGRSRKESSARCVNMDFSKLTLFSLFNSCEGLAEKGGVLVVSGFPVHHTSNCP